ncbi:MAG: YczE/YyaS/YitT family protein [Solirubrobacteraceae bacterium]
MRRLLNAVVVGLALAATVALVTTPGGLAVRLLLVAVGIALVALGGLYLTCRLGPGPRDGLMTALHRRTGRSVRLVRVCLELTVLVTGFLLGGTVGLGTVAFALGIGPGVQAALALVGGGRTDDL